jgi:hypothetical protein
VFEHGMWKRPGNKNYIISEYLYVLKLMIAIYYNYNLESVDEVIREVYMEARSGERR